jgi:CHAT domain-containing protein
VTAVETELRHLRFALRRATSSDETALASVATSGRRLEDLIVRPLRLGPDDGLVIVPTGLLHAMPWRLLPSLTERTIEVSPSATLWSRELGAPPTGPAVVVAGPGLPGALGEIADVAARRTGATVLVGDAATSGDVLSALDGAASAHLACHGRFRSDNPQFSSLLLADGPVVVYDLERLRQAPAHVVLSACDSARTAVRPGEEVLGLASALLASGTRSLVASVVPVADDATRRLMADLHDCWDGVSAPVDALAAAAVRASARGGADAIAAAAFNCFTAGAQPLA